MMSRPVSASGHVKRERVQAAVRGQAADRPPVAFWRHFPCNGSGARLAQATVEFFGATYDLDIAKVMPDVRYPFPRESIREPDDWLLVHDWLGAETAFTNAYVTAIRHVRAAMGPAMPLVVTLHAPLTLAQLFAANYPLVLAHLQRAPHLVHRALGNLAVNLRRHAAACIAAGADGIYLSLVGCDETIAPELYREIGRPYDLLVLQGAQDGWLNVAHLHGSKGLRVDAVFDYPINVISWSDRSTGPSIASIRSRTDLCLMGGWHERSPLLAGPAGYDAQDAWLGDARDAISQAGGKGLILAPGCSVLATSDPRSLAALRASVDRL